MVNGMAFTLRTDKSERNELFTCRWRFTNVSFEKDYLGVTKRSYEEELK